MVRSFPSSPLPLSSSTLTASTLGAELAVERINADDELLPGYSLNLTVLDSKVYTYNIRTYSTHRAVYTHAVEQDHLSLSRLIALQFMCSASVLCPIGMWLYIDVYTHTHIHTHTHTCAVSVHACAHLLIHGSWSAPRTLYRAWAKATLCGSIHESAVHTCHGLYSTVLPIPHHKRSV